MTKPKSTGTCSLKPEKQFIQTVKTFKADEGLKQNIEKLQVVPTESSIYKENESVYCYPTQLAHWFFLADADRIIQQGQTDFNEIITHEMNPIAEGDIKFEKGYSEVNGIKMYYEIYGEGKPLVLIHGGGSTIQTSFGNIIPLLSQNPAGNRCGVAGAWVAQTTETLLFPLSKMQRT